MSDRGQLDPFRDREIVDMYNAGAVAGVRNAAAPGDHRGVANGVMAASEGWWVVWWVVVTSER